MSKRAEQFKLEQESDAHAAANKLNELLIEASSGSADTPRASALVSRMYADVAASLKAEADTVARGTGAKYRKWLRAIEPDVAAVIAIRECIQQCMYPQSDSVRLQELAGGIGRLWELEVRVAEAEKVNPLYMGRVHSQIEDRGTKSQGHIRRTYKTAVAAVMKDAIAEDLTRTDLMQIGKFGVQACLDAGLIEVHKEHGGRGLNVWYALTEQVHTFLVGYSHNDVRNVISRCETRMLCEPDPWSNLYDGGYLTERRKLVQPLMGLRMARKSVKERLMEECTADNMPLVFETANYLQGVALTIHEPTRKAILRVWGTGGGVLGVPAKTPPQRPENPLGEAWNKEGAPDAELDVFARWKRHVSRWYDDMRAWRAHCREVGGFIKSVADVGRPLYFPVYMDTRGRWYYRGTPNPQGSDMSKAVLHFHQKRKLGSRGLFWLRVSIANCFGFDKVRFEDRARWTDQNWQRICMALDAPEDHPDVWGADSPWCMFAAAWELREALKCSNPAEYETGVPVHMDATCSGLQHFSAMLRDPVGALFVNLTDPTRCGPKQDVYARVSAVASEAILRDVNHPEVGEIARWWADHEMPRGLAKKPVMTYVYGATLKGTAEFIEDYLETELGVKPPEHMRMIDVSLYGARKLFQGIAGTVPAAASAMRWLRSVASENPNGKPMFWTSPSGFLVAHDYRDFELKRVAVRSCGMKLTLTKEFTEDSAPVRMQNAISPNFVHALDAAHLTGTAKLMRERGHQMLAIHDSFGTHPSSVDGMHVAIREAFVEQYSRNVMAEFMFDVGALGEAPMRGVFDVREVMTSEFFFC